MRADNHPAARIDDRDAQRRIGARRLRNRGRGEQNGEETNKRRSHVFFHLT
jgi:hypothetical protein